MGPGVRSVLVLRYCGTGCCSPMVMVSGSVTQSSNRASSFCLTFSHITSVSHVFRNSVMYILVKHLALEVWGITTLRKDAASR